jgi:hypothetical protein
VWAGVEALVPRDRLPAPEAPPSLVVEDEGDRYRICFGEREHQYVDAQRDCARRAHVAAVFVALTLVPPQFLLDESPPPPPPASPGVGARLELGPWVAAATRSDEGGASVMAGAYLRVAVGTPRVAVLVGAGASLPTTVGGGPAREQRIPLALGLRRLWRGARWEAGIDLEGVATLLRIGTSAGGTKATTIDPGARLGGILSIGGGRLMPFVSIFADMSFASRAVALVPDGVVGRTSWLRTGALAGVAWRFR